MGECHEEGTQNSQRDLHSLFSRVALAGLVIALGAADAGAQSPLPTTIAYGRAKSGSRWDTTGPDWTIRASLSHTGGMTTTEKIAVSLPRGLAERARRAVRQGRASSVSAYVAAALDQKANQDDLAALLDEMLAESGGPLTMAERRAADRALGVSSRRTRKA